MNKIIIPTGYMGSGSSAVTDLVAEFKNCKNEFDRKCLKKYFILSYTRKAKRQALKEWAKIERGDNNA